MDFENLSHEVREYINLSIDELKLKVVERMSQLSGDLLLCITLLLMGMVSLFFLLIVLAFVLSPFVGMLWATVVVAIVPLLIAFLLYVNRERIFINPVVRRLCRIFFDDDDDKK